MLEIVRKGEALTFKQWTDLFLENNSKPPLRAPKTYETHLRAVTHLVKVFGDHKLTDLTSDAIEGYFRYRLRQRARWKTKGGIIEKGVLKPSTVHQELRVLRRMLNIAVRKKLLPSKPVLGRRVPSRGERVVHTTLRVVVRAATDPHLRSAVDVRDAPERWRRGGRVGDAAPAPGRREGVQEVLADEVADEARGAAEAQSRGERVGWSFGTGGMMNRGYSGTVGWSSGTVLGQFSPEKRRTRGSDLQKTAVKSRFFRVGA